MPFPRISFPAAMCFQKYIKLIRIAKGKRNSQIKDTSVPQSAD